MIEIKKGKEPPELLAYRKKKYAAYDNMPREVHEAVLESLMKEQGYLCAYCMCKIPQTGKMPSATIEHWEPQSKTSEDKALDYRNMLAVCNGNRGCGKKEYMTCERLLEKYQSQTRKTSYLGILIWWIQKHMSKG